MAAKGAKGVEVGVGYVSIVPSTKGFAAQLKRDLNPRKLGNDIGKDLDRGIEQGIGKDPVGKRLKPSAASVSSAGSQLDSMLGGLKKVAVGAAVAGGAIVAAGVDAFKSYSDQNEAITKAQQVFGDAFARVDEVSRTAAKTMGMSRTTALDTAATFGNLFRSMGVAVGPATDMSLSLEQLAADLGSFNNVPTEEALDAIRSGLLGEAEPMRRFGSAISESRLEAEALSLGLVHNRVVTTDVSSATNRLQKAQEGAAKALKEHGKDSTQYRDAALQVQVAEASLDKAMQGHAVTLDAAQKAQAAYSLMMKDTVIAQGDFARTAGGAANMTKTLGAAWDDFKAKIGEKLYPLGTTVLGGLQTGLEWLSGWWDLHGNEVVDGVGRVKDKFFEVFGPDPAQSFKDGMTKIQEGLNDVFGPDKIESFRTGADMLEHFFDGVFGPDKVASFLDGAGKVTGAVDNFATKLDELFGEDKIASWQHGADMVGGFFSGIGKAIGDMVATASQGPTDEQGNQQHSLPFHVDFQVPDFFQFAEGGVVGGPVGAPQLVVAHGGETVLPTHRADLAALRGVTAGQLAPAAPGGPLVGSMTVTGQADPAGSAWAMRRELRRVAYYAGSAYT